MKRILKNTLKVVVIVTVAYVTVVGILTAISPRLEPIDEEDDDDFLEFEDKEIEEYV